MDLVTQMRVFVRVAEAQGFTAAARQLGVSKSVVSKYIAELENRLGVRLFHRTTRHLSLTEHGAGYYERCTHILAEIEDAEATVGAGGDEPRGTVRVLVPASLGLQAMLPAVPELLQKWPRLNIDLVLGDQTDGTVESACDVAVRFVDGASPVPERARMLLSIPTVLVGAPGYNGATAAPATPNDLAFHNCLSLSRTQGQDRWRFRGANGELAINVTGTLHANNLEALRFAVLRGLGIAVLPHELVREDLGAGRLVRMLPDHASLDWALVATTASDAPPAARVRAVLDFLTHAFQDTEAQPIADRAA